MVESNPRHLPEYQLRRLVRFCAVAVVWVGCAFIGGPIAGTLLALVLAGILLTVRFAFADWWHETAGSLARRPWRDWEEMLDVAARKLPSAVRRSLHGSLVAAPVVEVVLDTTTLARLAERLGIGQAEAELTERYRLVIDGLGATVAAGASASVIVHGGADLALGCVELIPHFGSFTPGVDPDAVTQKADAAPGRTRHYEQQTRTVDQSLRLRLASGVRAFAPSTVVTVGRAPTNTIDLGSIADDRMSRLHAEFRWTGTGWLLIDRSRNGVLRNGTLVLGEAEVEPGDEIRFGRSAQAPSCTVLPALSVTSVA